MQTISEVMTRDVRSISPEETVRRAAQLMDELNVGSLPVCDGPKLVGMITDRDITDPLDRCRPGAGKHPRRRRDEHRSAHLPRQPVGR